MVSGCFYGSLEKINYLLAEKVYQKDFVDKLIALEPKLKQTGEIPSIQTFYRYLNNQREIKVELIPYFAEALKCYGTRAFHK